MNVEIGLRIFKILLYPLMLPFTLIQILRGKLTGGNLIEDKRERILSKENLKKIITLPKDHIIDPEKQVEGDTLIVQRQELALLEKKIEKKLDSFRKIEEEILDKKEILLNLDKSIVEREENSIEAFQEVLQADKEKENAKPSLDIIYEDEVLKQRELSLKYMKEEIETEREQRLLALNKEIKGARENKQKELAAEFARMKAKNLEEISINHDPELEKDTDATIKNMEGEMDVIKTELKKQEEINESLNERLKKSESQPSMEGDKRSDESFQEVANIQEEISRKKEILLNIEKSIIEQEGKHKEVTNTLSEAEQALNTTKVHLDQINKEEKYYLNQRENSLDNLNEETELERKKRLLALDEELALVKQNKRDELDQEFAGIEENYKKELKEKRAQDLEKIQLEVGGIREQELASIQQELRKQNETKDCPQKNEQGLTSNPSVEVPLPAASEQEVKKVQKDLAFLKQSMAAQLKMDLSRQEEEMQRELVQKRNSEMKRLSIEIDVKRKEALDKINREHSELYLQQDKLKEIERRKKKEEREFLEKKESAYVNLMEEMKIEKERELQILNKELDSEKVSKTDVLENELEQRKELFEQDLAEQKESAIEKIEQESALSRAELLTQIEQEIEDERVKKVEQQEKQFQQEHAGNRERALEKFNLELESEKEKRLIELQTEMEMLKEKERLEVKNEKNKAITAVEEWAILEETRLKERLGKDYKLLQIKLRDELEQKIKDESTAIQKRFSLLAKEQKDHAEKDIKGYLNKKFSQFVSKIS